ncbi:HTH domain-containing protein [bacterium]|nr:HTH domain-containing protein [bacterium]
MAIPKRVQEKLQQETERAAAGFDSRFERVIGIVRLLSIRWHTCQQLADIFGVSTRTIQRDLDLLYRTGFQLLFHGQRFGYSLEGRYEIPLREPE